MLRLKYQILQISYHKTISNAYQNVQIKSALFNIYIFFQNLTSENLWNISFVFNEICREKGINWHTFSMCVYIKNFRFVIKSHQYSAGPVSLCGPVGKLILCQCSAEGCEEGQLPIGLCPSLPMMPLPPRMQCCPPMYVMYCSQQKRSMANRRVGGLNNSLLSQSSKMSPGL